MWLTQTYLNTFRGEFPLNLYLFFNRYTDWEADDIRGLRNYLSQLGRRTRYQLAGYMPNDALDGDTIGEELDHNFSPLVHQRLGREPIYFGLFICDKPLVDLTPDGSNGRWLFIRFDKQMNSLSSLPDTINLIEQIASRIGSDPIQALVLELLRKRKIVRDVVSNASLSRSGLSIKIGDVLKIIRKNKFLTTNIYD